MYFNSSSESKEAKCQDKRFVDLPFEIISHILEFLPYSYLQDARLVCKLWYAASHSTNLLQHEVIVCTESNYFDISNTLMKSHKPIRNLEIKGKVNKAKILADMSYELTQACDVPRSEQTLWVNWAASFDERFWMFYGPKLRSLSFSECVINKNELLKILSHCPELRSIEIKDCSLESGLQENSSTSGKCLPKLLYLESLKFEGSQFLDYNAEVFDSVLSDTKRLKSLMLINCMCERGLFGTTYLTPEHVLDFIQKNTHSLVNISFLHKVYANEVALIRLLKIPNLELQSLETNYQIPKDLFHRLKSLRVLKLRGYFRGELIIDLSELGNLRCLEINVCYFSCLPKLHLLKNLTSLSIGMYYINFETYAEMDVNTLLVQALCPKVNTVLKKLCLRMDEYGRSLNNLCLRPSTLEAIAKTHPALTDFEVDWPFVPDAGESLSYALQAFFKYQVSLQSLKLNYLEQQNNGVVYDERLASDPDDCSSEYILGRLKNLRKLDLRGLCCDKFIGFSESHLPDLTDLTLVNFGLSTVDLELFILNHPRIERLYLAEVYITDEIIDVIVSSLPRLKFVFIAPSDGIPEESIMKLKMHCKTSAFVQRYHSNE